MLSNEIHRFAQLEDGSKASFGLSVPPLPPTSIVQVHSSTRQLYNYTPTMEDFLITDRRYGSSAGLRPLPPSSVRQDDLAISFTKRSGVVAPTLVWGKGIMCSNSPHMSWLA